MHLCSTCSRKASPRRIACEPGLGSMSASALLHMDILLHAGMCAGTTVLMRGRAFLRGEGMGMGIGIGIKWLEDPRSCSCCY